MNIGSVAAASSYQAAPARIGTDRDGDNDNDATESPAAKAQEASPALALPNDPNRGRTLNISA